MEPSAGSAAENEAAIAGIAALCQPMRMKITSAVPFALVATSSLSSCPIAQHLPDADGRLTRQRIEVVHFGEKSALASIKGKRGLYRAVFTPGCQGCKAAEQVVQPASDLDISLCEFGMTVSGEVEESNEGLSGTLIIMRVDQQPDGEAGYWNEKPEEPCRHGSVHPSFR